MFVPPLIPLMDQQPVPTTHQNAAMTPMFGLDNLAMVPPIYHQHQYASVPLAMPFNPWLQMAQWSVLPALPPSSTAADAQQLPLWLQQQQQQMATSLFTSYYQQAPGFALPASEFGRNISGSSGVSSVMPNQQTPLVFNRPQNPRAVQQQRPPKARPAKHTPRAGDLDEDEADSGDEGDAATEASQRQAPDDALVCCDSCNLRRMPVHNTATIKWHQQAASAKPHEEGLCDICGAGLVRGAGEENTKACHLPLRCHRCELVFWRSG